MRKTKKDYINQLTSNMMNRLVDESAPSLNDYYEQLMQELQSSRSNQQEIDCAVTMLTDAYQYVRDELHEAELIE